MPSSISVIAAHDTSGIRPTALGRSDTTGGYRAGIELLLLLAVLWLVLTGYAFAKQPIHVLGHAFAQSEIAEYLRSPRQAASAAVASGAHEQLPLQSAPSAATASRQRPIDPAPQRILILGDSMIEGLLPRLADYAVENQHSVNAVIWYGSRTINWARGARLAEAMAAYRPTFVVVVVGSSELHVNNVEKRAAAIEQMLRTIGDRQLIWIGPPNWTKDTGINDVIERTVGSARYFRSAQLSFERKRDGIHPTLASSQVWMDAVARWIETESASPIKLDPPKKTGTPRPNVRVFPPPTA